MDCFAVSIACAFTLEKGKIKHALRIAFSFGLFQAVMPVIGWFAGSKMQHLISNFDHWIAFILLCAIGGKMIYESRKIEEEENEAKSLKTSSLLILSVATSIDALAVGLSISFLKIAIATPAIIIGVTAFMVSLIGTFIGKKLGHFFESKIEILGGLILIGIGIKILIQHLP